MNIKFILVLKTDAEKGTTKTDKHLVLVKFDNFGISDKIINLQKDFNFGDIIDVYEENDQLYARHTEIIKTPF